MSRKMYLTLPVKDIEKSMAFFSTLGFSFNPQFTDGTGACLIISESHYVMLCSESKWKEIVPRPISDTSKGSEVVIGLSCDSKDEVLATVGKALSAGAVRINEPDDYGFMFADAFQDLDGHLWNFVWMDESAMPKPQNT